MRENAYKSNLSLPPIGFGTADLGDHAEEAVFCAIRAGYRLIDTAAVYGSETAVGNAVRKAIEMGVVTRDELFVQTKLDPSRHGYREAVMGIEESLNKLQMDYIDAALIHWPVPRGQEETYREKNKETWIAFHDIKRRGRIRFLGVCNFLERHLLQLTESGLEWPSINQLEIHPAFQQRGLVRFCRERNMTIEAWSPMGRGILSAPDFLEMAGSYGKTSAQIALRWSIENGYIPLTRSSNPCHIEQNLKVFDFTLSTEDMERLNQLNTCDNHQDIWSYRRQQMY